MTSRPKLTLACLIAVAALTLSMLAPEPAGAWGERQAVRSCGTNWISSWRIPGGGHAATQKLRGNCSGKLQVGLRMASGAVRFGNESSDYAWIERSGTYVGGTHRGCYECAASLT